MMVACMQDAQAECLDGANKLTSVTACTRSTVLRLKKMYIGKDRLWHISGELVSHSSLGANACLSSADKRYAAHTHTYTHILTQTHTDTHTHTLTHTHSHTHTHTHTHTLTHTLLHTHSYTHKHIHTHTCSSQCGVAVPRLRPRHPQPPHRAPR